MGREPSPIPKAEAPDTHPTKATLRSLDQACNRSQSAFDSRVIRESLHLYESLVRMHSDDD
jgi:hypothetical protein